MGGCPLTGKGLCLLRMTSFHYRGRPLPHPLSTRSGVGRGSLCSNPRPPSSSPVILQSHVNQRRESLGRKGAP